MMSTFFTPIYCRSRLTSRHAAAAAMPFEDEHGSFAVIDFVAHLYRGTREDRRTLKTIWEKYSRDSEAERKSPGFEIVRMHHATLSRVFADDPDGEYLDVEDVQMCWEEFVDALRTATGAANDDADARAGVAAAPGSPQREKCYDNLEQPVLRRNASFSALARSLHSAAEASTPPGTSGGNSPDGSSRGGSTRGIRRISSKGMLLAVGVASREGSARGGLAHVDEWTPNLSTLSKEVRDKLEPWDGVR